MINRNKLIPVTVANVNGMLYGSPFSATLSTRGYATSGYFRYTFLRNFIGNIDVEHTEGYGYNSYVDNWEITHPRKNQRVTVYGYAFTEATASNGSGAWRLDYSFVIDENVNVNSLINEVVGELQDSGVRLYSDLTGDNINNTLKYGVNPTLDKTTVTDVDEISRAIMESANRIRTTGGKSKSKNNKKGKVKRNGTSKRDYESEY
jgi:hypothetical protein